MFHGNVHIGFLTFCAALYKDMAKNENIHFRFSVGSKIRCSYIKKRVHVNSRRVHCCRRTSLREGRRSESQFPRANVGRQFKEEMSFYQTEKWERKKQMIAELVPVLSRKFRATDYSFITV